MDDFREWLSDNLRYILLGLAIIAVLLVLFSGFVSSLQLLAMIPKRNRR